MKSSMEKLSPFLTESDYGLGADTQNQKTLERIYQAKCRSADHPLIVHTSSKEQIRDFPIGTAVFANKLATAY